MSHFGKSSPYFVSEHISDGSDHYCAKGIYQEYSFPNGYGASVVKHAGSYGAKQGLWEVAVVQDGELCYSTPITDDVIGHLNDPQVDDILGKISRL